MSTRPLKILLTDPHLKGGGQVRYVEKLASELTQLGHSVAIGCKRESVLVESARLAKCGLVNRFHYRGGLRPTCWFDDVRTVKGYIQAEAPDILHANGSQDHWVSAIANRLMGFPVCMVRSRHNTYPVSENILNRTLNLRWTDYQIAVCEEVREMRISRPVFDADRMASIHNGVDPDEYKPDAEVRKRVREEFGYTNGQVVLGMAARLTEAKGHRYLFEAAVDLSKAFPNVRLLLLGRGDLENDLKAMARELGIDGITHFAGFRTDVGDCIQAFDIGVQPSIACEASSFSVMEQMATEKPIVASDHGGTKEIVRDGIDGHIVRQGETLPLMEALRSLIADEEKRRTMGRSARTRVADEFSLAKLAERTVAAYRHALELHQARGTRR
ncbi:MAG: hypothetical protein AMXMBFR84_18030 [Candidatus Hydrogenedentota bacterium]